MALVDKGVVNEDSEMEEGEIVDDLDYLSDISSEEEFLLRQRLQVLENYNNVLERKKAKDSSFGPGSRNNNEGVLLDLSEISATDLEDSCSAKFSPKISKLVYLKNEKNQKHSKTYHKTKRRKDLEAYNLSKPKDHKKKNHRKKKLEIKVISESSEESDDEYRNKRRKLANAVELNRNNNDKSSLQDRLQKMLGGTAHDILKDTYVEDNHTRTETIREDKDIECSPETDDNLNTKKTQELCIMIDLCTDDDSNPVKVAGPSMDTVDSFIKEKEEADDKKASEVSSDEDLEQLRQHALKSKALKKNDQGTVPDNSLSKPTTLSDDEDSDTAELRLICLKSAFLKKAIEMKQKQKLRKRLSQSSITLQEDVLDEYKLLDNIMETENNTDIESVDMDIGSDADEKGKETSHSDIKMATVEHLVNEHKENVQQHIKKKIAKDDELEEDEDLLRAKLLTSLSKNLPNLVDPNAIKAPEVLTPPPRETTPPITKTKVPENRIVINLGESDSEGEHEATKNLTKMHMKLSEQIDFQQKLDMFLKSTRMEVEKTKLPDVVLGPVPQTPEKFVAKTVNHLPKSEQIEYRNLVKKMTELEKIKEARQTTMLNKTQVKDTLKPRNVSVDTSRIVALNKLEEQVALSRKNIAEESAIMLKLKEEATKLSQKYKIVANELKNISTAITLNKKEQRTVQNRLTKIRLQHQRLLNSPLNKHSKINGNMLTTNRVSNLQKENNPMKEEYKNPHILKAVKVSVANDKLQEAIVPNSRLSVEVDVTSNKKTVISFPNTAGKYKEISNINENVKRVSENNTRLSEVEEHGENNNQSIIVESRMESRIANDYESPLLSLERVNWEADPNAIMCPFEVGGNCKDPDCKYLHPKILSQ